MAMPNPEAMGTQLVAGAAALPPCAYAGMAISIMAPSEKNMVISFFIFSPYESLPVGG
jgi:hypothetical protein